MQVNKVKIKIKHLIIGKIIIVVFIYQAIKIIMMIMEILV